MAWENTETFLLVRCEVPGGWLYKREGENPMVFVPKPKTVKPSTDDLLRRWDAVYKKPEDDLLRRWTGDAFEAGYKAGANDGHASFANDLKILRTSLKRIAECTKDPKIIAAIPAGDEFGGAPYAERGWNALAARICDYVDDARGWPDADAPGDLGRWDDVNGVTESLDADAPDWAKAQQMYDPVRYLVIALANEKSFVATPTLFISDEAAEKFAATLLTSYRIVEVITPFVEG